jgi:hypothetical protein
VSFSKIIQISLDDSQIVADVSNANLTTVTVRHVPTDTYARGHAKRNPIDPYNEDIGVSLAYYRAQQRLSRKLERGLIRTLPVGA